MSTYLQKTNLALDYSRTLTLTRDNFDVAVQLVYACNITGVQDNLDEYLQYGFLYNLFATITDPQIMAEVGSSYWWNQTRIPMAICEEGRFKNMNSTTNQMGITGLYYCPQDDFNFTLYGSYAAAESGVLSF